MKAASYFLPEIFRHLYGLLVPSVLRHKALAQLSPSILERVPCPVSVYPPLPPRQAEPDRRSAVSKSPGSDYPEGYERMEPKPGPVAIRPIRWCALQADVLAVFPDTPKEPEELDTPLEQEPRGLLLINAILSANRELPILFDQRKLAAANINEYAMHNNLLVHQNQLVVSDENALRTRLCDEFHRPVHRAHPERGKMRKMIL
jgi:hypothetical protein